MSLGVGHRAAEQPEGIEDGVDDRLGARVRAPHGLEGDVSGEAGGGCREGACHRGAVGGGPERHHVGVPPRVVPVEVCRERCQVDDQLHAAGGGAGRRRSDPHGAGQAGGGDAHVGGPAEEAGAVGSRLDRDRPAVQGQRCARRPDEGVEGGGDRRARGGEPGPDQARRVVHQLVEGVEGRAAGLDEPERAEQLDEGRCHRVGRGLGVRGQSLQGHAEQDPGLGEQPLGLQRPGQGVGAEHEPLPGTAEHAGVVEHHGRGPGSRRARAQGYVDVDGDLAQLDVGRRGEPAEPVRHRAPDPQRPVEREAAGLVEGGQGQHPAALHVEGAGRARRHGEPQAGADAGGGGTGRAARSRARAASPAATTEVTARSTCARSTTPNTAVVPSPARGTGRAVAGTRRSRAGSDREVSGTSASSRARASGRSASGSSSDGSLSGAAEGSSRPSSRRVSASGWWSAR